MLQKEGQVRIPAGCAISGIFHKDGTRENGTRIIDSIRTMHDRSNGLGGGFAGYGIYPEYADYYAFHVFYDTQAAKEECEREIERHFDIVNLSKIPTRRHPRITDAPMIWRYFVTPLPTKLAASQLEEREFTSRFVIRINHTLNGAYIFSSGKNMGVFKANGFPEDVGEYYMLENYEAYSYPSMSQPLLPVAGPVSAWRAKGSALSTARPSGPTTRNLYISPCFTPGRKAHQTPPSSFFIGAALPSQPLKSPTTLTSRALGAQTTKRVSPASGIYLHVKAS